MARKRDLGEAELKMMSLRRRSSYGAKLFYTYVERATLLGVLYAIIPNKTAFRSTDAAEIARSFSWQAAVWIVGAMAILLPGLFTFFIWVVRWIKDGSHSQVEMVVRFLLAMGLSLVLAQGAVAIVSGVAEVLGTLQG
ncbi:hypothetical protein [uncultured Phenylobacterium sp.]|uniref:hypothetical protein n=1 Tax=uncultured Phenylobacterium sp. TaxID=349273 RepID=UPI0025F377B9|nr:hypothetical protein [uncultured Phenylobacterium sp.]